MKLTLESSFDPYLASSRHDLGATSISVTRVFDSKNLLTLEAQNQKWFRQTEAGVSFFGTYSNSNLSRPTQTVFAQFIYNSDLGLLSHLRLVEQGLLEKETLKQQDFGFQAFAEEDPQSTLSLALKCDFELM